jgi:hypothetical protein
MSLSQKHFCLQTKVVQTKALDNVSHDENKFRVWLITTTCLFLIDELKPVHDYVRIGD